MYKKELYSNCHAYTNDNAALRKIVINQLISHIDIFDSFFLSKRKLFYNVTVGLLTLVYDKGCCVD